jgi:hypothetical protein
MLHVGLNLAGQPLFIPISGGAGGSGKWGTGDVGACSRVPHDDAVSQVV